MVVGFFDVIRGLERDGAVLSLVGRRGGGAVGAGGAAGAAGGGGEVCSVV